MVVVASSMALGSGAEAKRKQKKEQPGADRVAAVVAGLERQSGLFDVYPDPDKGKLWVLLPAPDEKGFVGEYIYLEGIRTGLGSNSVGLDRGQMRDARMVRMRRIGSKVLFELPNLRYRALSDNPTERQAVTDSFATSVIWAGTVEATGPAGRPLVDLASFVLRDDHGVVETLEHTEQGTFTLDADRSTVLFEQCLAFPDNVELEALVTYSGSKPGPHVRSTSPDPKAVTLVAHYSFVRRPEEGYRVRPFDPREGFYGTEFLDYAKPLDESMRTGWIARHRLEKIDPSAASSPVKEPIVYYVDPGTPEPVRSALIDGASWWGRAFEAAGFIDGYRVELLPEEADPLDVRYNVIQWVHRSTRGWSYGQAITDPRTGEIIKGHVSLGSLRVRQDIRIFEGLLGTAKTGTGAPDDPVELALARIRQLAAHEVGHTLGITHNFAASAYGRESVMDYPAPLVRVTASGDLDASEAYAVGIGAWDEHAIRWGYGEYPPGTDEVAAQELVVREGLDQGLVFISDADARPAGAAHPLANLWDNGADPISALEELMAVRRQALDRFGEENIAAGRPLALLDETLAPIYLFHRYQVDAVGKSIGGVDYRYAVRGDGQAASKAVSAERQRRAVEALLATLDPAALDLSDGILALLMPRPFGYWGNREQFEGGTEPVFDALGAAAAAADHTLANLLQPERLARLVDQRRRDPEQLGLAELLDTVVARLFPAEPAPGRRWAVQQVVQAAAVERLVGLAASGEVPVRVRGPVESSLGAVQVRLNGSKEAQDVFLVREILRFLNHRTWTPIALPKAPAMPPGSPIGSGLACGWSGD